MKVARKLSVKVSGSWFFASISSNSLVVDTPYKKYYKVNQTFGITDFSETDPAVTMDRGRAGDYLGIDYNNVLSIMPKAKFKELYPKEVKRRQPRGTASFKELDNKDFYTEVVRNTPR